MPSISMPGLIRTTPVAMNWTGPTLSFYRRGGRWFIANWDAVLNAKKNSVVWTDYFVDPLGGNNSNDGLSFGSRKQTWASVLTAAASAGHNPRINCEAGTYLNSQHSNGASITVNVWVRPRIPGAVVTLLPNNAITWTQVSGELYKTTLSAQVSEVYDLTAPRTLASHYQPSKLIPTPSVDRGNVTDDAGAAVLNRGEYGDNGSTVCYVRTWDGRPPDRNLIAAVESGAAVRFGRSNGKIGIFEEMCVPSGMQCYFCDTTAGTQNSTLILIGGWSAGAWRAATRDGVDINGHNLIAYRHVMAYPGKDGFNLSLENSNVGYGLSYECESYYQGIAGTSTNNAFTSHATSGVGYKDCRVGCIGGYGYGPVFADISTGGGTSTGTKALNLGCWSKGSNGSTTERADFSALDSCDTWCYDCRGQTDLYGMLAVDSGEIRYFNSRMDGANYTATSGTITKIGFTPE